MDVVTWLSFMEKNSSKFFVPNLLNFYPNEVKSASNMSYGILYV